MVIVTSQDWIVAEKLRAAQIALEPEPQRQGLWTWETGSDADKVQFVQAVAWARSAGFALMPLGPEERGQ